MTDQEVEQRFADRQVYSVVERPLGQPETQPEANVDTVREMTRALVRDIAALEAVLGSDLVETGVHRIGAEQELFLVDSLLDPARVSTEILEVIGDPRIVPELARFNLEINLTPRVFGSQALSELEAELKECLDLVRKTAARFGARPILFGILPTLGLGDIELDAMTPIPRYRALNDSVRKIHGGKFRCYIKGVDEFEIESEDVMLEAVNTSFQVHYQVAPANFADAYNAAQLMTAPVLAAAVNSPVLFGHRLWAETRIATFQHSIDARTTGQQTRGHRARVNFGDRWVRESVLEVFREDASRFRVLLGANVDGDPFAEIARGVAPQLKALRLFNGTVYRWNRPCYGVMDGRAHLRIEVRSLPAGPTIVDEVANAAFLGGLLAAAPGEYGRIADTMPFDDALANFLAAARFGLDAQLRWPGHGTVPVQRLILEHLAPLARAGLESRGIDAADIDKYMGIIEERVRTGRTGAAWVHASIFRLGQAGISPKRHGRALTASAIANQATELPVHQWPLASGEHAGGIHACYRRVGQFMTTDLRTVREDDVVDLAAALMDWVHVRHIPVENEHGGIVGILSHRAIVRLFATTCGSPSGRVTVASIMTPNPITVTPDTLTLDVMHLMREKKIGCLPVVSGEKLVGIVTEHDLIQLAHTILEDHLKGD